ncbi:malic enzyme-like NAD(P)-binding protein, partial [Nocardiopsis tropica]|nr:malic enzyme-like NAD(P)-binding protein [Nocardiopsis tropica]
MTTVSRTQDQHSHLDEDPAFALHRGGKLHISSSVDVHDHEGLSLAYTPGVARVCDAIAETPELVETYTWKSNLVAVVTDGTAVLGLGDIGPEASLPVMEGKSLLFKQFGDVDSVPIALGCTGVDEIVETVVRMAPSFGGINLEDIAAPRCFEIERRLRERLDIPVFHDDQHGTAIVTVAALHNAARLTGRTLADLRVVVSGAGSAGVAVTTMLIAGGIGDIAVADSKGMIHDGREGLNPVKQELAGISNRAGLRGSIESALAGADVFIGLSSGEGP